MLAPSVSKVRPLFPRRMACHAVLALVVIMFSAAQKATGQSGAVKAPSDTQASPAVPSAIPSKAQSAKSSRNPQPSPAPDTPNVLVQFNAALEGLAAKVAPAVVQILVTG